jgi:type II secretory pathway component GspD/PulD (secretin)
MRRLLFFLLSLTIVVSAIEPTASGATATASKPNLSPAVINVSVVSASRAADILRGIYPRANIRVDRSANAVIVLATPEDVTAMRTIVTGIDVHNPTDSNVDAVQLHSATPGDVIPRLRTLFPHASFVASPNRTIVISASQTDMQQAKSIIAAIDTPPATPTPKPHYPTEAIRVTQRSATEVARALAHSAPNVHVAVSGSQVLVSGAPDDVTQAKTLITQLDQPQASVQYTQIYRLRYVDAASVADLLHRSFKNIDVEVDKDLNAVTVLANGTVQQRISDAIAQLDVAPAAPSGGGGGGGGTAAEVIALNAAVPGLNGAPSTSANDIAQTVTQALSNAAPDLKVVVPPNSTQLVLTGSQYGIELAKNLIAKLDQPQPLVVLDTEVLEVDETKAKNLGLQITNPVISSTFSEITPSQPIDGGTPPPLMKLQPFSRTAIQIGAQLNLLIQKGDARILADPRITTVTGRTASIRAGDQLAILTTTGGGTGTVATTQLQTFQTGVTLDITPVVNASNFVTLTLHPTLNSLSGILNGVPQISTRDATTTVGLMDNQTLVIGGLIEENTNNTENKIPIVGDIPLVGRLFRNESVNHTRNELIVTVTPHVVQPGENSFSPSSAIPKMPTPAPLPTLPPGTQMPAASQHPAVLQQHVAPAMPEARPSPAPNPSPVAVATPAPGKSAPQPLPTAFSQTNVFTYGSAPANNYADPSKPVQIFYVQVQPTVVKNGQPVTISAITSTNVDQLVFGTNSLASQTPMSKIGPGQWQSTVPVSTAGLPISSGSVQMMLKATSNQGSVSTIPIPISIAP